MPTKRCCCGSPCYEYYDNFSRPPDQDVEDLEPDWEVCGDWTDWTITPLVNTVANAKLVLKHMVGNPYGILEGKWNVQEGDVHLVHVFQGTESDACSGSPDYTVRFEWLTDNDVRIQIKQGSSVIAEKIAFTPTTEVSWNVCVGEGAIEANIQGNSTVTRACESPSSFWFAIGAETVGTEWTETRYSDHFNNNNTCPRCTRDCCFPDHEGTIVGFTVTIEGIEDGDSCSCSDTVSFDVGITSDLLRCECNTAFVMNPTNPDPNSRFFSGPHGCGGARTAPNIGLQCTPGVGIVWTLTLVPEDGFQGETQYQKTFPWGTKPQDIKAYIENLLVSDGDGQSCNYSSVAVTFNPIVATGCCTEEIIEPAAFEMSVQVHGEESKQSKDARLIEWLKLFAIESDRGVGDIVERMLSKVGGRAIKMSLKKLGVNCGCTNRQEALNKKYPL